MEVFILLWRLVGLLTTIAIVLFGSTVTVFLFFPSWFEPDFLRRPKTKTPITRSRR